MKQTTSATDGSFLFQIEIMVSGETNGEALEKLLHVLNEGGFEDFRIKSGIRLGKKIDEALAASANNKNPVDLPAPAAASPSGLGLDIQQYIKTNKLLRLNINKGRGIRLSIPCRVIGFDADSQQITVYHVDEKQVYSFKLNEIDDFEV
ncbi:hypothetical protein ACFPVX_04885 [Cohnella faecalis]|uniref:Uncharacterized protein n=1 Tax=Cohnella faecalis TaxID=2315694 RepID=A0A398CY88_9BACL|nr:hypothetical protein [Cohnella faecalis]RIE03964.1 hypothetical protein D3H35_08365 [Cohnella faecalis]